jgi:acyl-CoA thioesterase-1
MALQITRAKAMINRRQFIKATGFATAATLANSTGQRVSAAPVPEDDLEKIKMLLNAPNPGIWVFTGDSITHGAKHTRGCRSYPEIFGERLRWELKRFSDIVINTGISGNTTLNILNDFDWRISQFKPAVVSLMIGTNDCGRNDITTAIFKKNLEMIVTKIRETGAVPVLHTPNAIILEKDAGRNRLPEFAAGMRRVAENQKVILVDNYRYWEDSKQGNPVVDVNGRWLNDPIHPGDVGHQEIARLMFKTLSMFDPLAPTCGGPYYEGAH